MNNTDLPPLIRECVDGGVNPVTFGEIKARAVMTERAARRVPVRRGARLGVAATGLAAAGIAGALVASQVGGDAAGTQSAVTAAMIKHMASASQAAMTSGQAEIDWTSSGSSVIQDVSFDGANWNDVTNPGMPVQVHHSGNVTSWTGENINRVMDGQAYHDPSIARAQLVQGWTHIVAPGAAQSLDIPDPRTLLSVLLPAAGFVSDGYTTVNGVRLRHLRATTPGAASLTPLNPIIQSEPDNARVSALDLWVDSSDVVLEARITVTGTNTTSELTAAGLQAWEQYDKEHGITIRPKLLQNSATFTARALANIYPGLASLLQRPGMVAEHDTASSVTVTVTFSEVGQPQSITHRRPSSRRWAAKGELRTGSAGSPKRRAPVHLSPGWWRSGK